MTALHYILGDWGTTRLRLFLMADDRIVDRADGPGIGSLTGTPADTLLAVAAPLRAQAAVCDLTLCGMAGSRNGLVEVAYAACPGNPVAWASSAHRLSLDGLAIAVAAGMACTDRTGAPDVMRGEETQIFGALKLDPKLAHGHQLIVLPGTHSKWARLQDGQIHQFRTWMTGELFTLLRDHSTLGRAGGVTGSDEEQRAGFAHGLDRAKAGDLGGALFEARSAQLRQDKSLGWAHGYLSGLLIGREIADAKERLGAYAAVTLIGETSLTALYQQALDASGATSACIDGGSAAIAGLQYVRSALRDLA